uniref:Protegrin-2-like n=1 Tax=Tursiops truncatus TaxID=9739 RepID=A0A6J3RYJ2_TURTR|nr:protegrin-2-like [Tursiops truncatus]
MAPEMDSWTCGALGQRPDPQLQRGVIRALDQLNERSSEANLYRLLELDPPPKADENLDTPKPVSFTVKETVCPRTTQQPPEQCDFKENGLVKECVGTVTLAQIRDNFDITCTVVTDFHEWHRALSVLPESKTLDDVKATNFSGGQHRSQTQRVEESKSCKKLK